MVAKISTGKNIIGLVNYNEQKVDKGDARLIFAENMVLNKSAEDLSYSMKVGTFERMIEAKKSHRLDKTTFHVSLNFDPSEKLKDDTLKDIAHQYMDKMGYGNQPFLVYRHEDTQHPHIHIVSIKVDRDGRKIDDSFYKRKSEEVRKELEISFGLVKASEKIKNPLDTIQAIDPKQVIYGQSETKAAISNVVKHVVDQYQHTNLKEYQTVLAQYNIKAEHITGKSQNGDYEGLVYSISNDKGQRVGLGIKASSLYSKPTLTNLYNKFEENKPAKAEVLKETAKTIESVLHKHLKISQAEFTKKLSDQGINVQYHQGKQGIYGITFIDNQRKAVYKGSELGKSYSWTNLQKRFSEETIEKSPLQLLDKSDLKQSSSSLATIYSHLKKDVKTGEFFESAFIKKLDHIDLATPLMKTNLRIDQVAATELANQFKAYKQNKLPEIERKENEYFAGQVRIAMQVLQQAQLATPEQKLAFLHRTQIALKHNNDIIEFSHIHGSHIKASFSKLEVNRLLGITDPLYAFEKATTDFEKKGIRPYTKLEKEFISGLANKEPEIANISYSNFRYEQFKPLLSEQNQMKVAQHLTRNQIADIHKLIGKQPNAEALLKELDKRGIQVQPIKEGEKIKGFALQYYRFPEGKVMVNSTIYSYLMKEGRSDEPKLITPKYTFLVGLQQGLDKKDVASLDLSLAALDKKNPILAKQIKNDFHGLLHIAGYRADFDPEVRYKTFAQAFTQGNKSGVLSKRDEQMFSRLMEHFIASVDKYPGSTLYEEKSTKQANSKTENSEKVQNQLSSKTGQQSTLADIFSSGGDTSGVESQHKPTKKKKRRPGIS